MNEESTSLESSAQDTPSPARSIGEQALRFCIVGAINTCVDLTVLNILIHFEPRGAAGLRYSLFKALSFLAAVTNSYLLNRRFTFNTQKAVSSGQVSGFLIISLGGLAINVGVATAVATFVPAPAALLSYWPTIAAITGIPFGLIWNFFGYRYLVF